jgi:signal transduction histidine kinase
MAGESVPLNGLRLSTSRLGGGTREPDIPKLWGRRSRWYSRSRWTIAPLIVIAVLSARALGFEFSFRPVLLIALLHPTYNALLVYGHRRYGARREQSLLFLEVIADYTAMFGLIHFTGGIHSPLILFLIFHVIMAALQFSKGRAYLFASWAAGGLWLLYWFHETDAIASPPIAYQGESILHAEGIVVATIRICFLTLTFLLAALLTGSIVEALRRRVTEVAETTIKLSTANEKLRSLYTIVGSMGMERRIQPILDATAEQLGLMFEDASVGIALLEGEGNNLRFVAASGLPEAFFAVHPVDLETSGLHSRVLLGETIVQGQLREHETQPLRSKLVEIGIRSIVVARLAMNGQPIGTLGLYSTTPDRFQDIDAEFLEMTAELVAVAIEDARTNEEVETLVRERTRLMLEVAHNLRAPLGASMGLLDLVVSGYAGKLEPKAEEHLRRVVERLQALDETVGELLRIARSRDWDNEIPDVLVSLDDLARDVEGTFREEAERKGLRFVVEIDDGLPSIESGGDLLNRVFENLVSNAIKYTPSGGEVSMRVRRRDPDRIRVVVEDTGIGIPAVEQGRVFEEFYRASNAKKITEPGTGLGLAFVRHAIERHRGHLALESEEGGGTKVTIDLYVERPARRPPRPDDLGVSELHP